MIYIRSEVTMTNKYMPFLLLQIIAALLLLQTARADEHTEIAKCSSCLMKIENAQKKFSVTTPGRIIPADFDDIRCAFLFRNTLCAMDMMEFDSTAMVYDYYTGELTRMTAAVFVVDSRVKTPMDSGIIAFKDKASAERFLAEQGQGKIILFDAAAVDFQNKEK